MAPTLIIASKYDGAVDPSHALYAAEYTPHAELFLAPAESHLLWFSLYDKAVQAKIHAFLQA